MARKMIITPVKRKNRFAHAPFIDAVIPPIPRRPGTVQRAKSIITRAPTMKSPLLMAYNCIAKVNPQGRKKVATHESMAHILVGIDDIHTYFPINFGSVIENCAILGEIPTSFIPKRIITSATTRVIMAKKVLERLINDQKSPRSHQRKPNQRIRPRLK